MPPIFKRLHVRATAAALVLAAMGVGAAPAAETAASRPGAPTPFGVAADAPAVPGEIIVRYRPGVEATTRANVRRASRTALEAKLPLPGLELVRVPRGASVLDAVEALEDDPRVAYAEPNYVYRLAGVPNDPLFPRLWGLHDGSDVDMDAPEAWDLSTGTADAVVAVVDTGVAYGHPDLAPNIWTNPGEMGGGKETNGVDDDGNGLVDDWRGWDWVQGDNAPLDFNGHGTHVAGTIGGRGDNGIGVAGVNWNVKLMALRAADAGGSFPVADIVRAFAYASANGAKVVNASFGGPAYSQAIYDAIVFAPSTLFVAAAGNGGFDGIGDNNDVVPTYPCSYPAANLVCVAAAERTGRLAPFSNFGPTSVDLAAPGAAVLSSVPAYEPVFADGFETDLGGRWVPGSAPGSVPWARTGEARASGAWSIADSPGGSYGNNSDTWIATATPFNLTSRVGCTLEYALRLATELDRDGLLIEASSGSSIWSRVAGWSGSTGGSFLPFAEDLSTLDGRASVSLRFRLVSDAAGTDEGAHVDDVIVRCLASTFGPTDYAEFDGTSMAAPHVAGVAALVWAYRPGIGVADVKNALLRGASPLPSLAGTTATGGLVNALRSLTAPVDPPPPPDVTPPTNPAVTSRTHAVATWSSQRSVDVAFAGASDTGSGVDGFSYAWTTSPTSIPDTAKDAEAGATGTRSPSLADGDSWYFHLRTRDRAGNWSAPAHVGPFFVDATAPVGPAIGGAAFAAPFHLGTGIPVSWSASDATSGVGSYDVVSRGTNYNAYTGVEVPWLNDVTGTSGVFGALAGHTHCFSVRAKDRAGNQSSWSGELCTAVPLPNTRLSHGRGWQRRRGSGYYLGSYSLATRRGARLALRAVQGRRLALIATRCRRCGTVRVSWDTGASRTIRLRAPSLRHVVIPLATFDAVRTFNVAIVVTSSGRPVRIEGLGVSRN